MVVREPGSSALPVPPRTEQATAVIAQMVQHEVGGAHGGGHVGGIAGRASGLSQAADRHRVPRREHLVVDRRMDPRLARVEQLAPRIRELLGQLGRVEAELPSDRGHRDRTPQHVDAFPVPFRGGPQAPRDGLAHQPFELVPRPHEELAFHPLGVGVLRRPEPALGMLHLPQEVVGGLRDHAAVRRVAGHEPGAGVELQELRVVVEHLLEVGDLPGLVGGVAGEPPAEMVVDAPLRHPIQGDHHHLEGVRLFAHRPPKEELERHGLRELGRRTEPTPAAVEGTPERRQGLVGDLLGQGFLGGHERSGTRDRLRHPARLHDELVAPLAPGVGDPLQHLTERRHAVRRLRREVGARVERTSVGGEEGGQRPPSVSVDGLYRVHVDPVEVRPLLPVDLDRDEARVHERGRGGVFEGLALHDVTPVAGGVSDRQEDGFVIVPGARERLLAPRVPVHRVVRVLEEVGARLSHEVVRRSLGHGSGPRVPPSKRAGPHSAWGRSMPMHPG